MSRRSAFLMAVLVLAGTAVHADELQWTITGYANCIPDIPCNSQAVLGPGTITFDLNTLNATLTPTFGSDPSGRTDVLTNLSVSFPVTNYSAVVGGQTLDFAATGFGAFGCFGFPVSPNLYECAAGVSGAKTSYNFDDNEIWLHTLTEAQYKALADPLAFLLLANTGPPGVGCGNGGSTCYLNEPDGRVQFASTFTIIRVAEPGPLPLFVPALIGLALFRRRTQLAS